MSFLTGIGVILIGISMFVIYDDILLKCYCKSETIGKLIMIDEKYELSAIRRWRSYYAAIYEYEVDGEIYQIEGKKFSIRADYFQIGTQCRINYNSNNPGYAYVDGRTGRLGSGIMMIAIGGILIFFGSLKTYG